MTDKIINYDDLNFRINTLYNFMYGGSKNNYEYKTVAISELQLTDIKMDPQLKLFKFLELALLEKNKNYKIFNVKSRGTFNSYLKIGYYNDNNSNVNSLKREEVVDVLMPYFLTNIMHKAKRRRIECLYQDSMGILL